MTSTVWITGAAGFTGKALIQHLGGQKDIRIVGLDIAVPDDTKADVFLPVDLNNRSSLQQAVDAETPDVIIHLAGLMPPHSEQEMHKVNVVGSQNLMDVVSARTDHVRVICAGSAAEYDRHISQPSEESECVASNGYGRTKIAQTAAMLSYRSEKTEVIIARPFNLIGPGLSENLVAGGLCHQFLTSGQRDGYISPKGPIDSVRDFVDVRDAVSAYWRMATAGKSGEIYNICTGIGTSIARLIEIMQVILKTKVEVRPEYDREIIADISIGNSGKLRALGWKPKITLEQSISDMIRSKLERG